MKRMFVVFFAALVLGGTLLTASCAGTASTKAGGIDGFVNWLDVSASAGSRPLSGIVVTAWDENDKKVGTSVTDANGKFAIENVPAGTYTITAYDPGGDVEKTWIMTGIKVTSAVTSTVRMVYQNASGQKLPEKYLSSN